jgi:hypothetical protein
VNRTRPGVSASIGGADDDAENIALSEPVFRPLEWNETKPGCDETSFLDDDNLLKPALTIQGSTGSDKQTGPKRPK